MKQLLIVLFAFLYISPVFAADDNLNMVFTTTDAGGRYGKAHVHVIWLTNRQGQFITTVGNDDVGKRALWANRRAYSLSGWWNSNPQRNADVVARTGATPTVYKSYNLNWNWRKRDGSLVPDGDYQLHFENTNADSDNPRHYAVFDISKGRQPWSIGPVSRNGYTNVKLSYTIAGLSIEHLPPTDVSEISATLHGQLSGTENTPHQVSLFWGPRDGATDPSQWDYRIQLNNKQDESFSAQITGLEGHATYYYRYFVQGPTEKLWAEDTRSFQAGPDSIIFRTGSNWYYYEGLQYPGDRWKDIDLETNSRTGWQTGPTGIGYADGDDATELNMRNRYITVYMRYPFSLGDVNKVTSMNFWVDYDDGFVAYLNGVEVARRGVPLNQTKDSSAENHSATVDGGTAETIDLSPSIPHLQTGANVFAIEVHNAGINSSDLSMIPELQIVGLRSPQPNLQVSPPRLDFGTQPIGSSTERSVLLSNTGQRPLTIKSTVVVGLVAAGFTAQMPPLPLILQPGEQTEFKLQFKPTVERSYDYTQCILGSNDWDEPLITIALTGKGA